MQNLETQATYPQCVIITSQTNEQSAHFDQLKDFEV